VSQRQVEGAPGHSPPARARAKTIQRRGGRVTQERRQEIVAQAARLFMEHGYEALTIDQIVAEIGGSKRTIYAKFGGKAGLFETVIREYCAGVQRDILAELDPEAPIEPQLIAIGMNFLETILDPQILELHRLMVSAGRSFPKACGMFYRVGPDSAYELVASWIRAQQAAGRIGHGDSKLLATLYLDMLTGRLQLAALVASRTPSRGEIKETAVTAARIFLRGVQTGS
jgi:TetR/AcrR family transcriptional repressor of mexJK operon